jgi:SAM-dependent methyltransferase
VHHAEFRDRRLVEVYDAEYGWGPDDDAFLSFVEETPAARVLDLGCGTGRLTLAMARAGHRVTGVDPARASLDDARRKPGAERVTWIEGTAALIPDAAFDVAVMTSHVAQFFVGTRSGRARCPICTGPSSLAAGSPSRRGIPTIAGGSAGTRSIRGGSWPCPTVVSSRRGPR